MAGRAAVRRPPWAPGPVLWGLGPHTHSCCIEHLSSHPTRGWWLGPGLPHCSCLGGVARKPRGERRPSPGLVKTAAAGELGSMKRLAFCPLRSSGPHRTKSQLLLAATVGPGVSSENRHASDSWLILGVGEASAQHPPPLKVTCSPSPHARGSCLPGPRTQQVLPGPAGPRHPGATPSPRSTHPSARASVTRPRWQAAGSPRG